MLRMYFRRDPASDEVFFLGGEAPEVPFRESGPGTGAKPRRNRENSVSPRANDKFGV
jgi:hypothetical protein